VVKYIIIKNGGIKVIQLITDTNKHKKIINGDIVINSLSSPKSIDEFEINIIDLQCDTLWHCEQDNHKKIDEMSNLFNLGLMIKEHKKSKIIVMYPFNSTFSYYQHIINDRYGNPTIAYWHSEELKNMLNDLVEHILSVLVGGKDYKLFYELTDTLISDQRVSASFYFINAAPIYTSSFKSEKATTVLYNGLYLTSLDILSDTNTFFNYLRQIHLLEQKEQVPEWVKEYDAFDDQQQKAEIDCNREKIRACDSIIQVAQSKLDENNKYKSILYTQGDDLVDIVFVMLEKLLNCDLSGFHDVKKEDFLIKQEKVTFIGEIKGVTSNIRSEHVSQLDVHYQGYLEDLTQPQENVKAILIMDHQRNKPLSEREPVHANQIHLAERNESLIIETITLLKLFEKFQSGGFTSEQCIELLKSKTGLLSESDL
jgi:hypothetical protein